MAFFQDNLGYPAPEGWTILHFLKQRWWIGSGISWTVCKYFARHSRQITTGETGDHRGTIRWPEKMAVKDYVHVVFVCFFHCHYCCFVGVSWQISTTIVYWARSSHHWNWLVEKWSVNVHVTSATTLLLLLVVVVLSLIMVSQGR